MDKYHAGVILVCEFKLWHNETETIYYIEVAYRYR